MANESGVIHTGNRPKVSTETETEILDTHDPRYQEAKAHLMRAGERIRPPGSTHVGSVAVHYYEMKDFLSNKTFVTAEQISLGTLHEYVASEGFNQLRTRLMNAYGREEKKRK